MSESYTIGDDTNYQIQRNNWIAQTFTPVEDHRLWFVHLKVHSPTPHNWALMSVQKTLAGLPTGQKLDEFPIWLDKLSEYSPGRIWRPTLHGTAHLLKGTQYAIVISRGDMAFNDMLYWRGQASGAAYPRGQRLSSPDGGGSWTPYSGSDCYFVEFGNPPLPKPKPPPPIENFAPLAITYLHRPASITITLTTATPCHLTCYYTDKTPLKHRTERTIRGITVPWGTYFCFVAWDSVQQTEPGDSLYHTFEIPDWQFCQTKWLTFRGTVDQVLSPSIGPIFQHHHSGLFPYDITLQVADTCDEATRRGALLNTCQSSPPVTPYMVSAGYMTAEGYRGSGIRFTNVNVPHAATIIEAYLTFTAITNESGTTVNSRLSAEKADNPPNFSQDTPGSFTIRWSNRTISLDWDAIPPWTLDNEYQSPDITAQIQEITDRPGWQPGNALVIFWEDFAHRSSIGTTRRQGYSHANTPAKATKLYIRYEA